MAQEVATSLELRLVQLINRERADNGLRPVSVEVHLNSAAQSHSNWMASNGTLSHDGQSGTSPRDRIEDADFPLRGSWRTAENVAYVSITGAGDRKEADVMHQRLMESANHRANILNPDVLYVGIGLASGTIEQDGRDYEVLFLTQNFADTDAEVLVQRAGTDGEPSLVPYQNGVPSGPPTDAPDQPDPTPPTADPDDDEEDPQDPDTGSGGGCFVATAAYGNRSHPDVVALRRFRDDTLIRYRAGRAFIRAYWVAGPLLAKRVRAGGVTGSAVRATLSALVRRLPG